MTWGLDNYPAGAAYAPEITGEYPCGDCGRPMRTTCPDCDEPTCANETCSGCGCGTEDDDQATFGSGDTFSMSVRFGNASMREGEDLVRPLRQVADRLVNGETSGSIFDENGNTVGAWSIRPDAAREVGSYDRPVR